MPGPETPDGDALEQQQDLSDPESAVADATPEVALEAAEADAVEQQTSVGDGRDGYVRSEGTREADEGDLAESAREVGYDDDYDR